MNVFQEGQDVEYYFETDEGRIGALATVRIEGSTLILDEVAFFPIGVERLGVGYRSIRQMARYVEEMAGLQGFHRVIIGGKRVSGATPGRTLDFRRRLR